MQTHGIDHARRGFPQSWGSVAANRFAREALDDNAPDRVEVRDGFELDAVGVSAGRRQDGIFEIDAAESGGEAAQVPRFYQAEKPMRFLREFSGISFRVSIS